MVWILLCIPLVAGCEQDSKWGRIAVNGNVTLDGKPYDGGLSFRPERGVSGPTVNTMVKDGEFAFNRSTGPVVGAHKAMLMPRTDGARVDVMYETIIEVVEDSDPMSIAFTTPEEQPQPKKKLPAAAEVAIPEK